MDVLLVYIGLKCGDCNADSAGRRQCLTNGIATAGPRLLHAGNARVFLDRYHYYGIGIKETSIYYHSVYSGKGLTR